jgi:hypothetical protein
MPAFRTRLYELLTDRWESAGFRRGSLFAVRRRRRLATGDLVLALVNGVRIVARWFPSVASCDWLLQPGRLIRCAGAPVRILGAVEPLAAW